MRGYIRPSRCYRAGMTDDSFDDLVIDYADARFELRPHPTYKDLMRINALANELGYQMPFR